MKDSTFQQSIITHIINDINPTLLQQVKPTLLTTSNAPDKPKDSLYGSLDLRLDEVGDNLGSGGLKIEERT